jgi:hypothetical protein
MVAGLGSGRFVWILGRIPAGERKQRHDGAALFRQSSSCGRFPTKLNVSFMNGRRVLTHGCRMVKPAAAGWVDQLKRSV